jgi:hypothetical protein
VVSNRVDTSLWLASCVARTTIDLYPGSSGYTTNYATVQCPQNCSAVATAAGYCLAAHYLIRFAESRMGSPQSSTKKRFRRIICDLPQQIVPLLEQQSVARVRRHLIIPVVRFEPHCACHGPNLSSLQEQAQAHTPIWLYFTPPRYHRRMHQ